MNTYRHPLRQAYPFKIRINRGQPFRIAAAAGIGDPSSDAVDGAFKSLHASQRGNFGAEAGAHALKLGLFQVGHHIEGILLDQRNRGRTAGDKLAAVDVQVRHPAVSRGANDRAFKIKLRQIATRGRFCQLMLNGLQNVIRLVNLLPGHGLDAKAVTTAGFNALLLRQSLVIGDIGFSLS